jgi:hypothetical protein
MTTLRVQTKIAGVLADVTSVTLSDAVTGATYGIRRTDTGAVVVAAGTALTRVSAGVYEYEYADSPGVPYEWRFAAVYGGETYIGGGSWTAHVTPATATLTLSDQDECLVEDVDVFLAEYGEAVTVHPVGGADRSVTGIVARAREGMQEQPRGPVGPVSLTLPNSATTGISGAEWSNRFEVTVPRYRGGVTVRMRTVRPLQQDAAMITWELG